MAQRDSLIFRLAALLLLVAGGLPAQAATKLEQIRINPLVADQLVLVFHFDQPVGSFSDRLSYQPNQLLLLIPGAESALAMASMPVERRGVQQVRVAPKGADLEIAVELQQLMPYQIQQDGRRLLVTLGQLASAPVAEPVPAPTVASPPASTRVSVAAQVARPAGQPVPEPVAGTINRIKSLDFRRGKDGQGQLLVGLDRTSAALDVSQRGTHLIAKFHATAVADELVALMDVADFATPVTRVDVSRSGNAVVLDLAVNGKFEYRYDQADNLFILEVSPRLVTATAKAYRGKPISLNFQDVPVRTVLQLIADFNHFNLVTTDSVAGNITLRLDGVPWEQALDTVLKVKGLDKRLENNILLVAPAEEIASREKQSLESRQQVAELAPLHNEYIQINYAKAQELANLLSSDSTRLLSARGAVSVDERTNTLLIKDTDEVLAHVKRMIALLDVAVKQVVIEARMVTIDDGVEEDLGVRWGVTRIGDQNSTSGSLEGIDVGQAGVVPAVDDRLNVNLPTLNPAGQIAFQVARLADGTLLDLELSALEKENKAEIIASPRVTTANQKEALIEQGTEIPYVESSSSGATSVTFKKAVLSLKVTPQITPDNRVILDLTVTQNTLGEVVPTATGNAVAINAQSITTQVLVDNGETLVLGGIYQQTIKKDVSKVPLLGDIPGLGVLFRNSQERNSKRELLIFVTPKIVTEQI